MFRTLFLFCFFFQIDPLTILLHSGDSLHSGQHSGEQFFPKLEICATFPHEIQKVILKVSLKFCLLLGVQFLHWVRNIGELFLM